MRTFLAAFLLILLTIESTADERYAFACTRDRAYYANNSGRVHLCPILCDGDSYEGRYTNNPKINLCQVNTVRLCSDHPTLRSGGIVPCAGSRSSGFIHISTAPNHYYRVLESSIPSPPLVRAQPEPTPNIPVEVNRRPDRERSTEVAPKSGSKSPEFILLAMIIVGAFYVLGMFAKGRMEGRSIPRQVLVGCAIAVLSGVVLKYLDITGGEQLIVFTIAGLLVIAVSIFA